MTAIENELKFAELLISAVKVSLARSRWILSILITLCLSMLVGAFNIYLSWVRNFTLKGLSADPEIKSYQMQLIHDWIDSTFISLPVIGLKFNITDAGLMGAITIFILTLFLFYTCRRENHVIANALIKAHHQDNEFIKKYIYNGITSFQVFTTATHNDNPIDSLSATVARKFRGIRLAFAAFFYLPAITIFMILLGDVSSIWRFRSSFRDGHLPLHLLELSKQDKIQIGVILFVSLVLCVVCSFLGNNCHRYQRANSIILEEFRQTLPENDR